MSSNGNGTTASCPTCGHNNEKEKVDDVSVSSLKPLISPSCLIEDLPVTHDNATKVPHDLLEDENDDFELERFNGDIDTYEMWRFRLELILKTRNLWCSVERDQYDPKWSEEIQEKFTQRQNSTRLVLIQAVSRDVLRNLLKEKTPKQMMDALDRMYTPKFSIGRLLYVQRQLNTLRLKEGGDANQHLDKLDHLFHQMHTSGIDISEDHKVVYLLNSLPKSYDILFTVLNVNSYFEHENLKYYKIRDQVVSFWMSQQLRKGLQL